MDASSWRVIESITEGCLVSSEELVVSVYLKELIIL